jgi:phosphoribosylglycinamide formyltransferase-1
VKPLKVVVLASGSGTLFQSLIEAQKTIGFDIVSLVTDVQCIAVDRAQNFDIPTHIVPLKHDRVSWDVALCDAISQAQPDLIISAGFMRIIGPATLAQFDGRIINTHPALLPNFPGAHAVRDALAAGARETGSTIHFVDAGMDTGEVIAQCAIAINSDDTEASLHERIKVVERELLVETVRKIVAGDITIKKVHHD